MSLKEGGEGLMREFGGRKKKEKCCNYTLKKENLKDFLSKSCEHLRITKATVLI